MAKGKEFHRLTLDVEPPLHAGLKRLADKHDRSASRQAKVILKEYVEMHDHEYAKKVSQDDSKRA